MRKALKWIGIIVGGLVGVIIILAAVLHFVGQGRLNSAPEVTNTSVSASNDAESIERGRYLATISSCNNCHGTNLAGTVFVDEAPIGYKPLRDLT